ncbi:3-phosphoshikimate 1-carboxyvinyltransferase [Naumannella halotolerans]|uniref:3-phosphoshikimate 1-carboxyvinyltransferase n=1 Tax=Naumannella halotolerans TaxID=993414 RepID=A0A4R7JAS7_9ACTN|nr:3-phosphoshikimate 1-carboxyvinyltransferase [Naumannella halotolerans]TDT33673.1 3-phosphoshikimate 1-carboxyvinyltransferase [Naumannella halotolerans]
MSYNPRADDLSTPQSPSAFDPSSTAPAAGSAPRRAAAGWSAPRVTGRLHAVVSVPGSKSETNRALVIAALADGPSRIRGGLDARDTQLMRDALRELGVDITETVDGWQVQPPEQLAGDAVIDCGLAGTVMRFVPPVAAVASGQFRFDGDPAARDRPLEPLLLALADLGAGVSEQATGLPFDLTGRPDLPGGPVLIDAGSSSQYVSGLLLAGARYQRGVDIRHIGEGPVPSQPHLDMTIAMLREHGVRVDTAEENRWVVWPGTIEAGNTVIEPDLTNAAAFAAAAAIAGGQVTITDWPTETRQAGDRIRQVLTDFGALVELDGRGLTVTGGGTLTAIEVDLRDAAELTPVVAALGAVADGTTVITGVGHIRGHETDRLAALEAEINDLGGKVSQTEDGLRIEGTDLHGGTFGSYADHRLAHTGALLGLVVPEVVIDDIDCTSKTMPAFPVDWRTMVEESNRLS